MTSASIGIIASEFRPNVGGMESYAEELACCFREMGHDVHLFLKEGAQPLAGTTTHPILTLDLGRDLAGLGAHRVDRWLAVNSSYGLLARTHRRVYACAHGNDFLQPWVTWALPWLDQRGIWRLRRPAEAALLRARRRRHMGEVAGVFPNSDYTKERLLALLPGLADRTTVIHPGVADAFFQAHEPRSGGPVRLMTVARLDNDRKNVEGVIRALAGLQDRYAFRYTVIGDGAARPALEALVRESGLEDRVELFGRVPDQDLRAAYRSADLFVLTPRTSAEDVEGFGMVYLEANASGVPALASRGNGAADAVAEGVSGFFVDDPTPERCREALVRFFEGEVRFEAKAVTDHAERFRWPAVARRFAEAMELDPA